MSRGTAMSTMNIGRRLRARSASLVIARVMIGFGLAVEATTMSASRRCDAISSRLIAKPWNSAASSRARSTLRFATIIRRRPSACRCRAASAIVSPAPTISAVRESKLENTFLAIATAAEATDTALAPICVSVRTRFATENAAWNSRFSVGPVVPASCAAR